MSLNLTVGCDPELFVRDRFSGIPISAHGLIPGTKQKPFEVPDGGVQVDGMALEFNTRPARSFVEFDGNITSVLRSMQGMIPDTMAFDISPSIIFPDDVIASTPDEAKVLGCDPDFNAYTMEANPRPVPPQPGLRTASGHIHLGWLDGINQVKPNDPFHFQQCAKLVRLLDRFLGTASVIMDPDTTRRSLYGCAGAFRAKSYGLEYRVPSNAWIVSERRRKVMFELVNRAMAHVMNESKATHDMLDADVIYAINHSDVAECKAILRFMLEE